jgi:hypothetical protein
MSYYKVKVNYDTPETWGWGFEHPEKQYNTSLATGPLKGNYIILAEGVSLSDVANKSITLTEVTGDDLVKLKAEPSIFNAPPKPEDFGF